jgi:phage terminase large subunit-like protein
MKRGRVLVHDRGPALWPEYIDLLELAKHKRDVGTPVWNTMYQAEEEGLSGEIIWRDLFRYYEGLPVDTSCFMAVDLAISEKTSADETAIVIVNVNDAGALPDPYVYVRWAWHGRIGLVKTAEMILEAWNYYKPVAIGVEAIAYQQAQVELLGTEKYQHLPIEPVTPEGTDKFSRWLQLGALYERSVILHHPSLEGSYFENQLTKLPAKAGGHDDLADALSYAIKVSGMMIGAEFGDKPAGFR